MRIKNLKLILAILTVMILSLITIGGVTPQLIDYGMTTNSNVFIIKQAIGMIVGVFIIFFLLNANLDLIKKWMRYGFWIFFIMLAILALNPPIIGDIFVVNINGASGWFKIPFLFTIQPVEFMKIASFFILAEISTNHIQSSNSDLELIKKYLIYAGIPLFFVLLQPDAGGVLMLGVPAFTMFMISLKDRKIISLINKTFLIALIVFFIFIYFPAGQDFLVKYTPIEAYQLARFNSWLQPFIFDGGFQLQQSLILMGSAGLFGNGFGYAGVYLPEPHTDVIFSEYVGMFGVLAGTFLIGVYFYIVHELLQITIRTKEVFYKFVMVGYSVLFLTHIVQNIGMMLGVLPITGIVLPFFSYGMSAMITLLVIIGVILAIDKRNF